jgi:hypothetical protein
VVGTREERCLRHRELDGQTTPERVMRATVGCCVRTIKNSAIYEISAATERQSSARN